MGNSKQAEASAMIQKVYIEYSTSFEDAAGEIKRSVGKNPYLCQDF